MGTRSTPDITAFNFGYISPRLRGRVDKGFYNQALDYLKNYIASEQGELARRGGSLFVSSTRGDKIGRLMPYLFNTEQAYILEFTDQAIRFYKDHGLITQTPQAITAVTKANPGVVTYSGADTFANGDHIIISDVVGMHQLNGREFKVANVNTGANTFELQDFNGANVNTSGYSTYTSGGTVAEIVEIASPYLEADLKNLSYVQTNDTMYITHPSYAPRTLKRGGSHTSWAISTITFIGNPFGTTKAAGQTITAITKANPAVVTYTGADNFANGDHVLISGVVGMTEVNGKVFTVANVDTGANTFQLQDYDSTDNDAYTSGGQAEEYTAFSWPSLVTLFDGRLLYAASDSFPTRIWFSKIRADEELNDFTTGDLDSDAIIYKLRADQANRIRWIVGAENYIALGTSGSEFRITGGGQNDAITPTNISVKPTSFNGVSTVRPLRLDSYILFLQRNGRTVRSFEYNALQDGYVAPDRTLLAEHMGNSKFTEFSYTTGTPNVIWGVRENGSLAGLTFNPSQEVVAWHPHDTQGLYISVATIPEATEDDELWQIVTRTVNGVTRRYVEYTPNLPAMPVLEDFFTDEANEATDLLDYLTALWNVQKTLVYADCALVYDGRDAATVNLTITGTLTAGSTVTVNASAAYFTAAMATDQRRLQSPEGGQIRIDTYTNNQQVIGTVLYDLEAAAFASGTWYYMARSIAGLWHQEGNTVQVLADGGVEGDTTVTSGVVTLTDDAGYVVVGQKFVSIGKSEDVNAPTNIGGQSAMSKPRSITKVGVRMRASLGTKFGTSLYDLETPAYRIAGEVAGRPPRLVDGVVEVQMPDGWDEEKYLYFVHDTPTPSNIQYFKPNMEVNEEAGGQGG